MKGSEYAQYFAQEPKKVRNLDLNEAEIGSYAKNWPTQAPAQEQNTKHKTNWAPPGGETQFVHCAIA